MKSDAATLYLQDLGSLIKEKAREAKSRKDLTGSPYDTGSLMAFHDIISLMQSQADAFSIPREAISLSDINADEELL